jgi:hypothetical protein
MYEKALPSLNMQMPESNASWTVRAQPDSAVSHSGQRYSFSPPASPLLQQPGLAAAAATLYPGSESHRRAHVQSLAKMTREALAERLFHEKQVIVNLQERLVRLSSSA